MDLWVVRHAAAIDREKTLLPDEERPLTGAGRKEFKKLCHRLSRSVQAPDLVFSSPLVRAIETAELFCAAFGISEEASFRAESLAPGVPGFKVFEMLRSIRYPGVAIVGHEPSLSGLLRECMGGGRLKISKGAIACIRFEKSPSPGEGTLRWLVTPGLSR